MVNVFLIIVAAIVAVLVLLFSLYLLVIFCHPEDKGLGQAVFPKIVIVLGLSISIWTVLLFPLDVANAASCAADIPLSSCDSQIPMEELWFALYIANSVLVFVVIPFTFFLYEADSDWYVGFGRWRALAVSARTTNDGCSPYAQDHHQEVEQCAVLDAGRPVLPDPRDCHSIR